MCVFVSFICKSVSEILAMSWQEEESLVGECLGIPRGLVAEVCGMMNLWELLK